MHGKEGHHFWKQLIDKYLKPLTIDRAHKTRVEEALLGLRNKVCLAFLLMNALFITIVYTLTEVNKEEDGTLAIPLPCGEDKIKGDKGYGQGHIEPISFAFTAVFGIMLLVQFICMLIHRCSTFLHVIASPTAEISLLTNLQNTLKANVSRTKYEETKKHKITVHEGLKLARDFQKDEQEDIETSSSSSQGVSGVDFEFGDDLIKTKKSSIVVSKLKNRQNKLCSNTLSNNFVKHYSKLKQIVDAEDNDKISPTSNGDKFDKSPDEERTRSITQIFGPTLLTQKSFQTIVSLMQNDSIKTQISKKAERLQKLKQLKKEKAELQFVDLVKRNKGTKTFANATDLVMRKMKLDNIGEKIENLTPDLWNSSDSSDSYDDEDNIVKNLSDDSDISECEPSGKPFRGSFHVKTFPW